MVVQAGKKYGAWLRYLPPYSPDFNPIEWVFSKLKTWLRTARAHTRDVREEVIRTAAEWISAHDAKNGFDHCGYHLTIAAIMYIELETVLTPRC